MRSLKKVWSALRRSLSTTWISNFNFNISPIPTRKLTLYYLCCCKAKENPCDFSVTAPSSQTAQHQLGQHQQAHIMANYVCPVTKTLQSPDVIASPAGALGHGLLCFIQKKHAVKLVRLKAWCYCRLVIKTYAWIFGTRLWIALINRLCWVFGCSLEIKKVLNSCLNAVESNYQNVEPGRNLCE